MNAKDLESRIESYYNDIVFTADDTGLTISLEGKDGAAMCTHLIPEKVDELKAAITDWEKLYYSAAESNDD